jgi:hypothetical protein
VNGVRWFDVLEQRTARVLHLARKLNDGSWPRYPADHLHSLIKRSVALEVAPPKAGIDDPREVKRSIRALNYAQKHLTQLDYMLIAFCYGEASVRFVSTVTLDSWIENPVDDVIYSMRFNLNQYLVSAVRDEASLELILADTRALLSFKNSTSGLLWREQLESILEGIWIHRVLEPVGAR